MSILKYKYKAHKFINYAFYVVVFIVGFLLGFSTEKINFNKLISQVLMIDNVYAAENNYNIVSSTGYNVDTEYIYNKLFNETGYNIEDYPYILVRYMKSVNSSSYGGLEIYASNSIDNYVITATSSSDESLTLNVTTLTSSGNTLRYKEKVYKSSGALSDISGPSIFKSNGSTFLYYTGNGSTSNGSNKVYTNFDLNGVSVNSVINVLDFSDYSVNLEYNENLFKDNPDFKEVCVDDNSIIAITRTDNPENLEYMTDYDYIWFPYGVTGLKSYNYHNADLLNKDNTDILEELDWSSDNIFQYDNYSPFFFKDKETIDEIYNDEIKGENLKFKGYTDKNSYYGWTSALFNLWFDYRDGNNFNFFPIFEFENLTKLYINDSSGTIHGGGGNRLDGDNEIELSNQYCFYIKKEYSVTKVYKNEFNDISGNVPTQNGDFNFATSQNKNNNNSGNFLSQPKNFINSMKDTINFINSLIYEFYISLPLLLRTFIITLLIILIIMLIMKIGGYS